MSSIYRIPVQPVVPADNANNGKYRDQLDLRVPVQIVCHVVLHVCSRVRTEWQVEGIKTAANSVSQWLPLTDLSAARVIQWLLGE